MFRSPLQPMWDLTIYLPWGPTSSLVHYSIPGSDTICNNSSPQLVNIVRFGPLRNAVSFTVLKRPLLGRGFHTLLRNISFSFPTNVRSHNLIPLGDPTSSLSHYSVSSSNTICNNPSPPLTYIVRFSPLRIVINLTVL